MNYTREITTPSAPREEELILFIKKVAVLLLLILLWTIRPVLILILISAILAAGIAPVVRRLRVLIRLHLHRRIGRGAAILLVYLPFLLLVISLLVFGVPFLLSESQDLMKDLPKLLDQKVLAPLSKTIPVGQIRSAISQPGALLPKVPVIDVVKGGAGLVASTIAVLFMVFYILIDAERLQNLVLLVYRPAERGKRRKMLIRMARRMSSWLSAQLILAAIIAGATFVSLLVLRIPYALPLAVIAGIGELIPVIGPLVGAVPAVMVALLQSPWQFWSVVVMAVMIQQVENLVLVPRLLGNKLHVSPLGIFVAFMVGASVLGIVGAILAAPIAAVAQVAFSEFFVSRRERRQDTDRAGTLVTAEASEGKEAGAEQPSTEATSDRSGSDDRRS
ncbi:MAG TPA: AI-2E family transporter [Thermoanaerobaculia bacterium]|nr:AI-2E family transporter [Thermoanaerobaculia bacterium]